MTNGTVGHEIPLAERTRPPWGSRLALFLILLTGLALRLYGLENVSFWYDDYNTVMGLKADDLSTYFAAIRFISPDHAPGYFLLLFLWSKAAGNTLIACRLLSVFLGFAAIPLLYSVCKRHFGVRAALIAAMCMAISPIHIWYSQAIRYNALTEPISVISILLFLRLLQDGSRRWWWGNAAANVILFWVHPLTLLVPFVQLVTLLLLARDKFRRIFVWGSIQFLFLMPFVFWMMQSAPYTVSYEEDVYGFNWMTLVVDWLVDDAIALSQAWMFHTRSCPYITDSPYSSAGFLKGYGLLNLPMLLLFGFCLTVFLAGTARAWRNSWRCHADTNARWRAVSGSFILLLHTLPLSVLICLSYMFRPVLMPHYTLFSTLATYIAVGTTLAAFRSRYLRVAALAATLFVFGYQTGLILHEPTRFDWLSAARYVEKNAAANDLVLVRGRFFATETFRIALGPSDRPILSAYTLQAICDKADRYLPPASSPSPAPPRIWAVVEMQFDSPPLPIDRLETVLRSRGFRYTEAFFPGMGGITVYGIERDSNALPEEPQVDLPTDYDFDRLLKELELYRAAGPEANRESIESLRRIVETDWPRGAYTFAQFSIALSDEGCAQLAEAAALKSIELRPNSGLGYFVLSLALAEQRDTTGAKTAFERALELDRIGFIRLYQPLFHAAYEVDDIGLVRDEIRRLDSIDLYVPQAFRARAASPPEAASLRICGS